MPAGHPPSWAESAAEPSLDDYWSWLAEQLDFSAGRLEGESPDSYPEVDITDVLSEILKQLELAGLG